MRQLKEYKYQIGHIITDVKSGKLKILEQIKLPHHRKNKKDTYDKGYRYQCLICGNIDNITENKLNNKQGCNACCTNPQKILKGYNDIHTTNKQLFNLLANPEDGYKYTEHSSKKVDWKCPDCGNIIRNKRISDICKYGLSCFKCGDGISYSEKLMYNLLRQLAIEFQSQLNKATFKWCSEYKYDFYIPKLSMIIEMHGGQHYIKSFETCNSGRTLQEEKSNNESKKHLALQNKIENYIIIDCRYSDLYFIKNNILKSELSKLFDLSNIDWLQCYKYACSSRVKEACNYWNNGIHSTIKIGKIMKLNKVTITKYLKQGVELGRCQYDVVKVKSIAGKRNGGKLKRKVTCLNNHKIFNSIIEASRFANLKSSTSIVQCCKGQRKTTGKHPETGEPLKWMYYDDYIKLNKKAIQQINKIE